MTSDRIGNLARGVRCIGRSKSCRAVAEQRCAADGLFCLPGMAPERQQRPQQSRAKALFWTPPSNGVGIVKPIHLRKPSLDLLALGVDSFVPWGVQMLRRPH